jgi:two-component system sensor histidine kinase TctE
VQEVNALMLRLGKTLDFQNRFIADAAHQLKTPVSGLKAQIELALREHDPARVRHSLAQLYVGADRLSRLVRQLLSLARNEPGAARPCTCRRST